MQSALAALGSADGDQERQLRALLDMQGALKTCKPGAVPQNTVAALAGVLTASLQEARLMLVALQCMAAVCGVLRNAAPIMRLEGGLQATLAMLQASGQQHCVIATCGLELLASLCGNSPITAQGLLQEKGASGLLLSLLEQHVLDKALAGAACDILMLASKYSKGAKRLAAEVALVPTIKQVLEVHMGDVRVSGAAVKTLKNVAKHEECRPVLEAAGAVPVLLSAAACFAIVPEQLKQLKRTCRALWLLCPHALSPLPKPSVAVPLPHRDSKHLSITSAKDSDAERLMQLFPELQGNPVATASTLPAVASATCSGSPATAADPAAGASSAGASAITANAATRMLKPPVAMSTRPPTAAELTAVARDPCAAAPEPFHAWGSALAARMMLHDLQRIVAPAEVVNKLVYDDGAGAKPGRRVGPAAEHACTQAQPTISDPACDVTSRSISKEAASHGQSTPLMDARLQSLHIQSSSNTEVPAMSNTSSNSHCTSDQLSTSGACQAVPPPPGQLQFESHFEGGNLRAAVLVRHNEYDLFLAPDTNDRSKGGNMVQWFYFAVCGATPGVSYQLNLVNCCKKASLYNAGKQPLMCAGVSTQSTHDASRPAAAPSSSDSNRALHALDDSCSVSSSCGSAGGWFRVGRDVAWYPSPYRGRAWAPSVCTGATSKSSRTTSKNKWDNSVVNTPCSSRSACTNSSTQSDAIGSSQPAKSTSSPQGSTQSIPKQRKSGTTASSSNNSSGGRKAKEGAESADDVPQAGPGLYCCTFSITFPNSGVFFIANCYPYSYKDLQDYLVSAQLSAAHFAPAAPPLLQRSLLCHSLAAQRVELLTVTDFSAPPEVLAAREYVVISARVHPGETCASWIMQGMLDFLLQPHHPVAQRLRACFVFKIIPMLNPDGVAAGSYRCSLAGIDLNRTWERPLPHLHPPIYHTKKLIETLAQCGRLALCLDLHGHSRLQNVFFFGCEPLAPDAAATATVATTAAATAAATTTGTTPAAATAAAPGAVAPLQLQSALQPPLLHAASNEVEMSSRVSPESHVPAHESATAGLAAEGPEAAPPAASASTATPLSAFTASRLRVRMLPYLASRLHSGFSFANCSFKTQKGKAGTARVVCARQLGIPGSYTVEASLGGCSSSGTHFSISDYLSLGAALCEAVSELVEADDASLLEELASSVVLPVLADKASGTATTPGKAAMSARRQSACSS